MGTEGARLSGGAQTRDRRLRLRVPRLHSRVPRAVAGHGCTRRSKTSSATSSGWTTRPSPSGSCVRCGTTAVSATKGYSIDPGVREHASARAAYYGADASLADLIFEEPRELLRRFVRLLEALLGVGLRAGVGDARSTAGRNCLRSRPTHRRRGRLLLPDRPFAPATDRSGPARDPPGPSARTHGRNRPGSEARPRPERFRVAARPVELRPALAGDDRVPSALLACRREGQTALGGGAPRPPRARRRHTPARSEADRYRRSFDAGACAADRNRARPASPSTSGCLPGRAWSSGAGRATTCCTRSPRNASRTSRRPCSRSSGALLD